MEKTVEELECASQRQVIRSQPFAHESDVEDREIAPVLAPVSAWGAPAVSADERGLWLTVESWYLLDSEGRMGFDSVVILMEQQQQKCAFERYLKAVDAALAHEEVLPTVRETSLVALNNENDLNSGLPSVGERWSLEATAHFEAGSRLRVRHRRMWLPSSMDWGQKTCPHPKT